MGVKAKYKTRQREELIAFLKEVPGKHLTAADICEHFKTAGVAIGMTTVYRQLEKLVSEGLVHKYIIDSNSPACFEYIDPEQVSDGNIHFHCKCESCGELIHLKCNELLGISSHLKEHHNFAIDPVRTVFYGRCESCMKQDKTL